MTGFAVLKVDDLGRRPLLIGGVGGLVCILSLFDMIYFPKNTICVHCSLSFFFNEEDGGRSHLFSNCVMQALSLLLLSAYYQFLGNFPVVAVAALLLYVGCYQVTLLFVFLVIGLMVMDFFSSLKLDAICILLSD